MVRRIHTIEGPRSIQAGPGGVALVGHSAAGAVTLLEGRPPRVRRVLRGFEQPRYTVFAGDHAFVTDSGSGEVAVIDLRRGRVVRRVEVGALARHVTVDPAGRRLWISLGSSASAIAVVDIGDPLRPRVVRTVHPPFLVHDVGFSPSGRRVWLTAGREPRLAIYRADGSGPVRLLRGDRAPQHLTFGPSLAYVASGEGRSLHVHSLTDGRLLRAVRIPIGSYNVQRGAGMRPDAVAEHGGADVRGPPRARAGKPACRRGGPRCVRRLAGLDVERRGVRALDRRERAEPASASRRCEPWQPVSLRLWMP